MSITDEEERDLRVAIMRADLELKHKQGFWETPRNLAIFVGAVAALVGALSGLLGFKLGQSNPPPSQTIIVQFPPGTTVTTPK
jgi:hypothetical protein